MEVEAKFALPDKETFKRLQALRHLAGYDLCDEQVKQIRDTYLDTPDRRILRAEYMCRRRELGDQVIITLKRRKSVEGAVHRREELEVVLQAYRPPSEWPDGSLRDQILNLIGDAPLTPLFGLRQRRLVRAVNKNDRTVGELSLDQVNMTDNGRERAYRELEVELGPEGTERDLDALVAHFEIEWGLEPQSKSKFERALAFFGETAGSASASRDPQPAPADGPVAARQAETGTTATVATGASLIGITDKRPPKTPNLDPDDSMAEAARKTFYLHFQRMLYHEPGTRLGEDIEELHDMRVATRRMRAAVAVFEDYLDPEQMQPFTKGLRRTGRTLGAVRDLDVFGEKMRAYLATLSPGEQDALDPLLAVWQAEREKARKKMLDYLDGKRYARFKEEFGAFLQTPGAGALPVISDDSEPRPHRLRHVVPVAVYDRLAHVRAYDEYVSEADVPLERLHQLRIATKRLRYTLEFFQEVLGPEAKPAIDECKALQDHLGDLQDAGVASNLLRDFLTWGTWGPKKSKKKSAPVEPIVAPGVAAYLTAKQTEIQYLVDTFPEAWARFKSPEFSAWIASAVAVL